MDRTKTFRGDWLAEVAHPWHLETAPSAPVAHVAVAEPKTEGRMIWHMARGATVTLGLLAFSSGVAFALNYLRVF